MGVPSELGCSDYARRALVALDFPYSEGGGGLLYIYNVEKSVLYKNIWKVPNNRSGNCHEIKIDYFPDKGQKE